MMSAFPVWNFEQWSGNEPGDDSTVNLRAWLDRVPDAKLAAYQPDWPDQAVMDWCGDFRDDGVIFLPCSERDIDVSEFRREVEACIRYRALTRAQQT